MYCNNVLYNVLYWSQNQNQNLLSNYLFTIGKKTNHISFCLTDVYRSNASKISDDQSGLFPLMSRINHSCVPNTNFVWREDLGQQVVIATTFIGNLDICFHTINIYNKVENLLNKKGRSLIVKRAFDLYLVRIDN